MTKRQGPIPYAFAITCGVLVSLAYGLVPAAMAHGGSHGPGSHVSGVEDFDRRRDAAPDHTELMRRNAEQSVAVSALESSAGPVAVDWSPLLGTPTFVRSVATMLTPAARGADPAAIINDFVASNEALFGIGVPALDGASVIRDAQATPDGLRSYWLGQSINGVPIVGCDLRATLTADGRIAGIGSTMLDLSSPQFLIGNTLSPVDDAIRASAIAIGVEPEAFDALANGQQRAGSEDLFEYFSAQAVYAPVSRHRVEPAHRLTMQRLGSPDRYEILTIADDPSPAVLKNLTRYAGGSAGVAATYRIYPGASPTPMTPASPSPNGDQPVEQDRVLVSIDALDPIASPIGWVDPALMTTAGNNIRAQADINSNNGADEIRPDAGPGLIFDFPLDTSSDPSTYIDAAVTQAFYTGNWAHDVFYRYGFTEGFGAYQQSNFGRGGVEGDPILIDVQDGAAENNARFISSGADGSPGRVELFLWTGTTPARDSALDNHIVIHEMAHGLTERLLFGIEGSQGKSMGEGWSDYFAISLLTDPSADSSKTFPMAPYVALASGDAPFLDNYYFGIRRFPYSTDLGINPLTFQDIDPSRYSVPGETPISPLIAPGNPGRIHQVGEVWCSALWECRAAMIASEGPTGAEMFDRLVVDSLKILTTSEPTMVMARDAILIADLIAHDGAHLCDLWDAFAKRGLGTSAVSPSADLTGVIESFDSPAVPRLIPLSEISDELDPGAGDTILIGLDPGCSDTGELNPPVLWYSINSGAYQRLLPANTESHQFEFTFPPLACGDEVSHYIELTTPDHSITLPPLGAAAPYRAIVAIDPALGVIRPSDRGPFDFFGFAVDLDDGVLITGASQDDDTAFNAGAAYIFESESPTTWSQRRKLLPPTDEHSISFGYRVAVRDDIAAVSAIRDSTRAPASGAVYVFRRDGSESDNWPDEGVLTALDGEPNDGFGSGLAITEDQTVYVGALGNDTQGSNAGAVYAYENKDGIGWSQVRRLLADDGKPGDGFGTAVAANNEFLIVGAPGDNSGAGTVYCYRRTGPAGWVLEDRIIADPDVADAQFGASLDFDGERLIVGAPNDNDFFQNVGAAYVFRHDGFGNWVQEAKLSTTTQRGLDEFGAAVSIEGDLAVVTALRSDFFANDGGGAFAYERTGEGWRFLQNVEPQVPRERIQFGSSVAIDEGIAALGAWLDGEDRSATGSVSLYRPVALDCDANGIPDICDIAAGLLPDADLDGVPDACGCSGDLNGDFRIDTADLGMLIARFGTDAEAGDLNIDGVVDLADLGLLLAGYGLDCIPQE